MSHSKRIRTIFIPGYRECTELMLEGVRRAREKSPMKYMADERYAELIDCAVESIEWAKKVEKAALRCELNREAYVSRCDSARQAIYTAFNEPMAHKGVELFAQKVIAAVAPRPNARSPMRAKIIALMHSYKIDGTEFETFMQAWRRETLDGLRLTCLNPEAKSDAQKFSVDNENEEKKKNHELTRNTLQRNYWTEA